MKIITIIVIWCHRTLIEMVGCKFMHKHKHKHGQKQKQKESKVEPLKLVKEFKELEETIIGRINDIDRATFRTLFKMRQMT